MPTTKLTQAAVDRLKPPAEGRVEYWDSQCPGFGLRISAPARGREGRKVWQVLYRVRGKLVRETIGTLATFPNVVDARQRARESLQKAASGINPLDERLAETARQDAATRATLGAVIDRYLAEYAVKRMRPDYLKETERSFRVDVATKFGQRQISELTRRDIRELLGAIVARGHAPHASHVLRYLRAMLSWAVAQELIETNPAAGIPDPDPRKREARERDRYLDDDEIRDFWFACDRAGHSFAPLFKLLLLTGARRDELANATWVEFDLERREWTLPRAVKKRQGAYNPSNTARDRDPRRIADLWQRGISIHDDRHHADLRL
jgi:hypothetical protein